MRCRRRDDFSAEPRGRLVDQGLETSQQVPLRTDFAVEPKNVILRAIHDPFGTASSGQIQEPQVRRCAPPRSSAAHLKGRGPPSRKVLEDMSSFSVSDTRVAFVKGFDFFSGHPFVLIDYEVLPPTLRCQQREHQSGET